APDHGEFQAPAGVRCPLTLGEPDRRALDDVVFDVLGLTQGEREAVYEAVINLVKARLEKARSIRTTDE
ncbi:MAG: hypothetical protein RML47_06460, partial [Bacteroidota bacterium]|nr:hypothetical protein [Bacteroidota bacterium]